MPLVISSLKHFVLENHCSTCRCSFHLSSHFSLKFFCLVNIQMNQQKLITSFFLYCFKLNVTKEGWLLLHRNKFPHTRETYQIDCCSSKCSKHFDRAMCLVARHKRQVIHQPKNFHSKHPNVRRVDLEKKRETFSATEKKW